MSHPLATARSSDQVNTPTDNQDVQRALERARKISNWMDDRFRIPGTKFRIGFDGLLGLIPGVGDTVSAAISTYLIGEALRHDLPKRVAVRMGWNVLIDAAIGTIPLVGDLFDFAWKANRKNAALLAEHLQRKSTR